METVEAKIDSLIPYEFNNRNHDEQQVDRIANSIQSFGFNQPIVVDENNVILVGHGRLLAAQKLGLKTAPVLKKTGLTETQKKAYRILDNKLQNDSTWSFDNLELELGFLEDNGFELEPWGLEELRDLFTPEEPEVYEDDPVECENDETFIKLGDVIELGPHRVMCGDSTSAEDVSTLMRGEQSGLVLTDPPYGLDKGFANDGRGEWLSVLKAAHSLLEGVPTQFWFCAASGDLLRDAICVVAPTRIIIWHKPFNLRHPSNGIAWHFEPCLVHISPESSAAGNISDVISINPIWLKSDPENQSHPTQKPVVLFAEILKNWNADIVIDPFLGSGTTLIASDQLGRICYGMEIEPKYCHVIIKRYKQHCAKIGKPFECKINGERFDGAWS